MKRAARAFSIGAAAAVGSCGIFNDIILPSDAGSDGVDTGVTGDVATDASDGGLTSYLSREEAARFCSIVNGCPSKHALGLSMVESFAVPLYSPDATRSEFSMCMHWLTEVVTPDRFGFAVQQAAMKTIAGQTCESVARVTPILVDTTSLSCAQAEAGAVLCADGGTGIVFCEGAVAATATCGGPLSLYSGATCTTIEPTAGCVGGACDRAPSCDAGVAYYCSRDGRSGTTNCPLSGRDCVAEVAYAHCKFGPPCGQWMCEGPTLHSCTPVGLEGASFTCPSGTTCTPLGQNGGYCKPAGSTCTPANGGDRCEGDTIHYCAGGRDATFDCRSINWYCRTVFGMTTCSPI
jgi:hypothetical protein